MKDPFEVLGVERDSTKREIKAAYRKLAKEFHPDLHPDNADLAERFKEITAAYETLSNDSLRKRYGEAQARGTWGGGFAFGEMPDREPEFDERFGSGDKEADLVGDIAGNRRGRGGTSMWMAGENLFHEITVDFLEAARGARKELKLPTGVTLDVEVPPATEDGAILTFPGWGFPGYGGGDPGSLNLQVKVAPHPVFKRLGADILTTVTIDAAAAARGTTIVVPTLAGEQKLRVRKGARNGDVLTIKGGGLRVTPDGPRGDQRITLAVRGA
jgi:DnaJ-class molecular chaperone